MIRNLYFTKTINGLNKIDSDYISTSISDSILATDRKGLLYGIVSNSGKYLKDNGSGNYAFSDITINDVNFHLNGDIVVITNSSGKLTSSVISTTKLNFLYNVTSDIQTQLNSLSTLLATKQDVINASNKLNCLHIGNGDVSNSVLSYIKNLSSDAQTQLNNKQSILSVTNLLNPLFIYITWNN